MTYAAIEAAMNSRGNLCIIPMQDYLELPNEKGRMNTPSVAEGNWGWRLSSRYATKALIEKISDVSKRCKRV
jgi:4-alpha-glucanotransferase